MPNFFCAVSIAALLFWKVCAYGDESTNAVEPSVPSQCMSSTVDDCAVAAVPRGLAATMWKAAVMCR